MRNHYSVTYINRQFTQWATSKVPYSFDFKDLNPGAVPWDAYADVKGCNTEQKDRRAGCPKTILDDYKPVLALPKEAVGAGIAVDFVGCEPGYVNDAVYVPITASRVEMPSTTRFGVIVTVGPRQSTIEPGALARIVLAQVTAAPQSN
jgi:hypothetical protein